MRSLFLVATALALVLGAASPASATLSATDKAVLNFALNLEYLEANFYHCAAFGQPIPSALWVGGMGQAGKAPIGCPKGRGTLSIWARKYANEIALDELGHVKLLRAVLGKDAVAQPLLDVGPAFAAAAQAAAQLALKTTDPITFEPAFDVYNNDTYFYHAAFIFEDVGVTAYVGAAKLIDSKDILTAAAKILAIEAYHSGSIRTLLYQMENKQAFSKPALLVRDVVKAISDLRDAVDGSTDLDQGIVSFGKTANGTPYVAANVVPTDANRIAFERTTSQVLRIVYLGGKSKGGFFPQGLNGAIMSA